MDHKLMEIIFLGTSSMVPTKERNHSSILLNFKSESILVDCGEGTQRQLKLAGFRTPRLTKILITHWHGDHVLGLPGLLQTLAASEYAGTLEIYGPRNTEQKIKLMQKVFVSEGPVEYKAKDIYSGIFIETPDFQVEALPLKHSTASLGFAFVQKPKRRIKKEAIKKLGIPEGPLLGKLQAGETISWNGKKVLPDQTTYLSKPKKVVFLLDTALSKNCIELANDADLLIAEATFDNELEEKAMQYKHLTAGQAGYIANTARVKKMVLTHFSQRYKNTSKLEEQARKVFDNVVCAEDFMKLVV